MPNLLVNLVKITNLADEDHFGKSDPYVKFEIEKDVSARPSGHLCLHAASGHGCSDDQSAPSISPTLPDSRLYSAGPDPSPQCSLMRHYGPLICWCMQTATDVLMITHTISILDQPAMPFDEASIPVERCYSSSIPVGRCYRRCASAFCLLFSRHVI